MYRIPFLAVAVLIGVSACNDNKPSKSGNQTSATSSEKTTPKKENLYPPCHPGCFPGGTAIATPDGLRAIETIKPGEIVTLVASDGSTIRGPVLSVFRSTNRLVDLRTESGTLRTTGLQPLCLASGGFQTAGNLKTGDVIWRWLDGKRQETRVMSVVQTEEDAPVFNLVVGESAVFVAGGFLAKGKPPATEESAVTQAK